jgi:dTDP-glucose 4,6-dehydratase
MDTTLIERELGWRPAVGFEEGIARTVAWYLEHRGWWQAIRARGFAGGRLGLAPGMARS